MTTDFGGSEFGEHVAAQPDGKVIVVGERWDPPYDFLVARYTTNGHLDPSFDGDGKAVTDFDGRNDATGDVTVQRDGKIVAAGWTGVPGGSDAALVRYRRDGRLDPTFGDDGKVRTSFRPGSFSTLSAVVLQADGKIVAGGGTRSRATSSFALARYRPDGTLDASFGTGGRVITPIPGRPLDSVFAFAIQRDGKVVAAGGSFEGDSDVVLARYNRNGQLDRSFAGDGIAIASFRPNDMVPLQLLVQRDGKLLAPGYGGISRFTAAGKLDTTFGQGGKADMCCTDTWAAALQPDGKILAIGTAYTGGTGDFTVARLAADGRRDLAYGRDGVVVTDLASGSNDQAFDAVLSPNGKLTVAGGTGNAAEDGGFAPPDDFALARYVAAVYCVVPDLRGTTLRVARSKLSRAHCRLGATKRAYSAQVARGRVISQRPGPHAQRGELTKVQLIISRGRKR